MASICASDCTRNGACKARRLVTSAVDHARAGTTAISKPPLRTLSITGSSAPGTGASALASVTTFTAIDPFDSASTCRENSSSGRLLGWPAGWESATVTVKRSAAPPALRSGRIV